MVDIAEGEEVKSLVGFFGLEGWPKEPEATDPLHSISSDIDAGMSSIRPPKIQYQLLSFADIEREVVLLTPLCQESHALAVGRLIVVGDQAHMVV